ncbi:MAG: hypothetical protein LBM69_03110 [Lachnospiraceae bacterium]|jgi:ribosomal-protein-alanine N-acetyltransferase|nr:hypothetical protein [Lachnospiraceae bacterium]
MRKFSVEPNSKLTMVICNKCGKIMKVEGGLIKEGCFTVDFGFGYFSDKDGARHKFDLCESCYDQLLASMVLPAEIATQTELI